MWRNNVLLLRLSSASATSELNRQPCWRRIHRPTRSTTVVIVIVIIFVLVEDQIADGENAETPEDLATGVATACDVHRRLVVKDLLTLVGRSLLLRRIDTPRHRRWRREHLLLLMDRQPILLHHRVASPTDIDPTKTLRVLPTEIRCCVKPVRDDERLVRTRSERAEIQVAIPFQDSDLKRRQIAILRRPGIRDSSVHPRHHATEVTYRRSKR